MRSLFLVCFVLAYMCMSAFGQKTVDYDEFKDKDRYVEGYVIHLDKTKEEGLVKTGWDNVFNNDSQESFNLYAELTFIAKDGERRTYLPNKVRSYGFDDRKFISYRYDVTFYEILFKGDRINYYRTMTFKSLASGSPFGAGTMHTSTVARPAYFFRLAGDREVTSIYGSRKFAKYFGSYFEDCPDLKKKIHNDELDFDHIMTIIEEYENCH